MGPQIQINMIEVGLGLSMLIQMITEEGEVVRILADGGEQKWKYHRDHVANKLPDLMRRFDGSQTLDMMIGTHYDWDHLHGLIGVASDPDIQIKSAWLPPVANNLLPGSFDYPLSDEEMLAHQFEGPSGRTALHRYTTESLSLCREAKSGMESTRGNDSKELWSGLFPTNGLDELKRYICDSRMEDAIFRKAMWHIEESSRFLPNSIGTLHVDYHDELVGPLLGQTDTGDNPWRGHHSRLALLLDTCPASVHMAYAAIRKSSARNAITAANLHKLVQALGKKNVPIQCQFIQQGKPEYYVWSQGGFKQVSRKKYEKSTTPKITLLGPSEQLIKKHQRLLPVLETKALLSYKTFPVKQITESNELSYVLLLEFAGQAILISGDAGCVDFKENPGSRQYQKRLIDAIQQPNVIQVAHHAGNNAHFYNVVNAAIGKDENRTVYLLVSHGAGDPKRPTKIFGQFVDEISDRVNPQVLFTEQPLKANVGQFEEHIAPQNPPFSSVQGVELLFDGKRWNVKNHSASI